MEIEINKICIQGSDIEAVFTVKGSIEKLKDRYRYESGFAQDVTNHMTDKLSEKLLLERGPEILSQINNNQIINAVIMRVSGALTQQRG